MDIKNELLQISQRTSIYCNDLNNLQSESTKDKSTIFSEFLQTLFEQFKQIGDGHSTLINLLNRAINVHKINVTVYDIGHYWMEVQSVVSLLEEHSQ